MAGIWALLLTRRGENQSIIFPGWQFYQLHILPPTTICPGSNSPPHVGRGIPPPQGAGRREVWRGFRGHRGSKALLKRHLLFLATAEASSSLLWFCSSSFLADLMDNSELIRNVTLCGHLHHGKVVRASAVWRVVAVFWLVGAVPIALEPSVGLCRLLLLLWE